MIGRRYVYDGVRDGHVYVRESWCDGIRTGLRPPVAIAMLDGLGRWKMVKETRAEAEARERRQQRLPSLADIL